MYVVIMGAGRVGLHLARSLINAKFDVTIIKKDPRALHICSK